MESVHRRRDPPALYSTFICVLYKKYDESNSNPYTNKLTTVMHINISTAYINGTN